MITSIETFFDAWGMGDDALRASAISSVYGENGTYTDPRSSGTLEGPAAIADYINMFSANAPGWTAQVVKSDENAGVARVTVAFGGKGPDGSEMVQHGQYIVEMDETMISRMVGFAGTGEPE